MKRYEVYLMAATGGVPDVTFTTALADAVLESDDTTSVNVSRPIIKHKTKNVL